MKEFAKTFAPNRVVFLKAPSDGPGGHADRSVGGHTGGPRPHPTGAYGDIASRDLAEAMEGPEAPDASGHLDSRKATLSFQTHLSRAGEYLAGVIKGDKALMHDLEKSLFLSDPRIMHGLAAFSNLRWESSGDQKVLDEIATANLKDCPRFKEKFIGDNKFRVTFFAVYQNHELEAVFAYLGIKTVIAVARNLVAEAMATSRSDRASVPPVRDTTAFVRIDTKAAPLGPKKRP